MRHEQVSCVKGAGSVNVQAVACAIRIGEGNGGPAVFPSQQGIYYERTTGEDCQRENFTQNSGGTVSGRIENLTPWQKGTSGNPGGRPKKRC
jgi:hypothetical protein